MAQLTGSLQGTHQADVFLGTETVSGSEGSLFAAGILNAAIEALAGDDRVEGLGSATFNGSLTPQVIPQIEAYGILASSILSGTGADVITATGEVNATFSREVPLPFSVAANLKAVGLADSLLDTGGENDVVTISGVTTIQVGDRLNVDTYGVFQSGIRGEAGRDSITVESRSSSTGVFRPGRVRSYGMASSSVDGGDDEDTIRITNTSCSLNGNDGTAYGLFQAAVTGESGDDIITVTATMSGGGLSSVLHQANGIENSFMQGGAGSDTIQITAQSQASSAFGGGVPLSRGILAATVAGGSGNDTIAIRSEASGSGRNFTGRSYGVLSGSVTGDSGDDIITIDAFTLGDFAVIGLLVDAYGASNALIDGGTGNDSIAISASTLLKELSILSNPQISYGLVQSTVNGGSGDDSIAISASNAASSVLGSLRSNTQTSYGLFESKISGGEGNDQITAIATTSPAAAVPSITTAYGIFQSTIDGGAGDDSITATGTTLAIQDALIDGGDGDDAFDTGTGSGTIDGGAGVDRIKLDFFNSATMTLKLIGGAIEITGTVDNLGNANAWTQRIFNVEQFAIGSQTFSANQLAQFAIA